MASSSRKEQTGCTKIRAARLSAQQFEVLIQFMQQYPHFAVGRAAGGSCSKEQHDTLWRALSTQLNETEGPMKSVSKWQKCWVDLKSNARSRAAKARAMPLDSPVPPGSVLTQWDERVLKLLNKIASDVTTLVQSPLQLLEVGVSDKVTSLDNGTGLRTLKGNKPRKIAPKQIVPIENGFHAAENGSVTVESMNSLSFDGSEDIHQAEDDVEELIADVKSEVEEEWLEEERTEYEEDCLMESMNSRNDSQSTIPNYSPYHRTKADLREEQFCPSTSQDNAKRRKFEDPLAFTNFEDSMERLSKKLCGTLDRMATAAEEANEIQMGMVNAMNRLASSFEQFLPIAARVISKSSDLSGSS